MGRMMDKFGDHGIVTVFFGESWNQIQLSEFIFIFDLVFGFYCSGQNMGKNLT
jgi:hypothetical protein